MAELSRRDLGSLAAATLLGCSASSARNYLRELMDAGVVSPLPNPADGIDRTVYRLNSGQFAFHAALAAAGDAGGAAAVRDPLVAALFGAPPPAVAFRLCRVQ